MRAAQVASANLLRRNPCLDLGCDARVCAEALVRAVASADTGVPAEAGSSLGLGGQRGGTLTPSGWMFQAGVQWPTAKTNPGVVSRWYW